MSVEQQVAELERRHQALKRAIEEASGHPGSSDLDLAAMKRLKLHLKDEIVRMRHKKSLH